MSKFSWVGQVFSLEIRKHLSYRVDFWSYFLGAVGAQLAIAYFLWKSIFDFLEVEKMQGYSFSGLMLYYLLVPLLNQVIRGAKLGYISEEIYQGSLTRYLIYPVNFFAYKYTAHAAFSFYSSLQILCGLGLFALFFSWPADMSISFISILGGIFTAFLSGYLFFAISAIFEMVAFWADNVWSLVLMVYYTINLLGGGYIPLSFFPPTVEKILYWSPFPYLLSFPLKTLLGQESLFSWLQGLGILIFWAFVFTGLLSLVWQRGTRQYTGVGI